MKRALGLLLTVALLLSTVHRLPAPISEAETPTPAPKRAIKHKASEDSESSTKRQTPLPPQTKATAQQNPFDGTWVGKCEIYACDNADITLLISSGGTRIDLTATCLGESRADHVPVNSKIASDGRTVRLAISLGLFTLTPNPDGQTAHFTCFSPGNLLVYKSVHSSATFQKVLP